MQNFIYCFISDEIRIKKQTILLKKNNYFNEFWFRKFLSKYLFQSFVKAKQNINKTL